MDEQFDARLVDAGLEPTRVSRALQSLGKDLRSISGNHDRIVVLPAIAKNFKNRSCTFESFRVRDIDEDGILEEIGVETVFVSTPSETRVSAA